MSMACLLPFATAVDEIIMPFLKPIDAGDLATLEEQHKSLNQVLSAAYTAETTGPRESDIANFYIAFGEKAMNPTECKSNGFKPPPPTKDQKAENCVRASISAAHKWMATQEGCPEAHKAVKQKLIETLEQELLDTISNIDQPPHAEVDAPSTIPTPNTPFTAITNLLERMEKSRNENA